MPDQPTAATDDPYAQIARWYDLQHDAFSEDVRFYEEVAAGAGPTVLEIGCGTGRITVALARMGRTVTGVDLSAAMLARGQARLEAEPAAVRRRVTLLQADARHLAGAVAATFGLAIIPLNTLAHCATLADRLAVLGQVRERLVPGGALVLDVDLAGPRQLLERPGQLWLEDVWTLAPAGGAVGGAEDGAEPDASQAIIQVAHLLAAIPAPDGEGMIVTHLYDAQTSNGTVRRTIARMPMALVTRTEVELTLRQAGFAVEAVYGDFELTPYEMGAPRAVFLTHALG